MPNLYLFGDITFESAERLIRELHENPDAATLWLCSDGGSCELGFALYDAIRTHGNVTVIGTGTIGSMALCILLAGKTRIATPLTRFFCHPVIANSDQPNQAMLRERDFIQNVIAELVKQRAGISAIKAKELIREDTYFGVSHAKTLGIVQEIG